MTSRIRLKHLQAFRAIVNAGSITAATRMVNLSQPAISRLLAVLEEELGFKLFYRRGRRLVATVEGQSFFRRIEGTLSGIDDIPSIAADVRVNSYGRLRICSIGPLLLGDYLPKATARFQGDFPDAKVTMEWRRREDIDEWVSSRQADIGFTLLPIESNSVTWRKLITVRAVAIFPKGQCFDGRETVHASELRDETTVLPKQNVRLRQYSDAAMFGDQGDMRVDIETSTAVTSCHLVANNVGVGISDPFSVSGLGRDRLGIARLEPELTLTYCAIWPKDREPSQQAMDFLDAVAQVGGEFFEAFPEACPV
ncbi:LysR family transcriptional regulator [Pseudooctadecabacter jejudonensis]|nr:LysR family transcriptional regulator [Pseudooctadecabacter jejudonensis]